MRVLFPRGASTAELTDDELEQLYAFAGDATVRSNFVSTLDGAVTGADGLSGSINNAADKRIFGLQRRLCDVVLVGAGTARDEGYRRIRPSRGRTPLLAVVSARCDVPTTLASPDPTRGDVVLVTCESAGATAITAARQLLGHDGVWVMGEDHVDLQAMITRLRTIGQGRLLCEGGPTLHHALLTAGLIDEMALTLVPRVVGGDGPRITQGGPGDTTFRLRHLLEADSTTLHLYTRDAIAEADD